jgi:hypothetical protein
MCAFSCRPLRAYVLVGLVVGVSAWPQYRRPLPTTDWLQCYLGEVSAELQHHLAVTATAAAAAAAAAVAGPQLAFSAKPSGADYPALLTEALPALAGGANGTSRLSLGKVLWMPQPLKAVVGRLIVSWCR